MRMYSLVLATIVLVALGGDAYAQPRCSELAKLRDDVVEAAKQLTGIASCEAYSRFTTAWGRVLRYANTHRESCEISGAALTGFDSRHREAVMMRNAVCAGRPLQPFPPDIIRQ